MESCITASACLALKIVFPGAAWSWWAWHRRHAFRESILLPIACTLVTGILVSSLTALVLGICAAYTPAAEIAALALVTGCGVLFGLRTYRESFTTLLRGTALLFGCATLVVMAIGSLPNRGEWIVGGWDPGIYVNEGIALDTQHTFYPDDAFYWNQLTEKEQALFIRTGKNRTERFPAVILDADRHAFQFQFFRLTPALLGLAHRSGGLALLHRVPTLLALCGALVLFVILTRAGQRTWGSIAVLALCTQPLFLYHAHTPVAEMMELVILFGLILLLPYRAEEVCVPFLFALTLLAGGLNRFTFIPLAAFFILLLAAVDVERSDRRSVYGERVLYAGALLLALSFNHYASPASLAGWADRLVTGMYWMTGLCLVAALALDVAASFTRTRSLWRALLPTVKWAGLAVGTALFACFLARPFFGPEDQDADNALKLVHYVGALPLSLSLVGAWMYVGRARQHIRSIYLLGVFTAGIALMMLYEKNIVDWYPWATRRYVSSVVPFVALFASYPLAVAWAKGRSLRVLCVSLLAMMVLSISPQAYKAWNHTEYNGVATQLTALSRQLKPNDIVIADDPRWGTPLTFLHGVHVLNGKRLWRDASGEKLILALEMAERLSRAGVRVRFFTSTDQGLSLYPHPVAPVSWDWSSEPFTYEEIIHHPRATSFDLRTVNKLFRLYTFMPGI